MIYDYCNESKNNYYKVLSQLNIINMSCNELDIINNYIDYIDIKKYGTI